MSSAAAWTSHLTGVRPEEGGITGFTDEGEFVTTSDIAVRTYPELLDSAGYTVGLVNIPLTYPPLELENGFCVPGQLTPLDEERYGYPDEINDVLETHNYEVDIQYGDRQYAFVDESLDVKPETILDDVARVERKRLDTARHLLKHRDIDLFFVLVNGTDPMQHYFWHELDDQPLENTAMMRVYSLIDEFIGDVRSMCPDENLLLFSDHGFRRDVWGADEATRERWRKVRQLATKFLPRSLTQTQIAKLGLDTLATIAEYTTAADPSEYAHTGSHDPEGVWMLSGPDIESRNDDMQLEFLDLPATVLALMGSSVPTEHSGNVPTGLLSNLDNIDRENVDIQCERRENEVSEEMREQLNNLGYVEMVEKD